MTDDRRTPVSVVERRRRPRWSTPTWVAAAAVSVALDHHVRTGAHLFGLLSDPAAKPLYASLGFAVVDHAQMWRVEGP